MLKGSGASSPPMSTGVTARHLAANNALDFDDLLLLPVQLLAAERAGAQLLAPPFPSRSGG